MSLLASGEATQARAAPAPFFWTDRTCAIKRWNTTGGVVVAPHWYHPTDDVAQVAVVGPVGAAVTTMPFLAPTAAPIEAADPATPSRRSRFILPWIRPHCPPPRVSRARTMRDPPMAASSWRG